MHSIYGVDAFLLQTTLNHKNLRCFVSQKHCSIILFLRSQGTQDTTNYIFMTIVNCYGIHLLYFIFFYSLVLTHTLLPLHANQITQ